MSEERGNTKTYYIGISRSGKSVVASMVSDIIHKSLKKRMEKDFQVLVHDPQGRFESISTEYINDQKDVNKYISYIDTPKGKKAVLSLSNCMVIIDESMHFFDGGRVLKDFLIFAGLCGENNIEVKYICHHPTQIPPKIGINLTHLFIYYAGAGEESFESDKIQNAELAKSSMLVCKEYVRLYPRGKDGYGQYPIFPYAFIDLQRGTSAFINMPEIIINNNSVVVPIPKEIEAYESD